MFALCQPRGGLSPVNGLYMETAGLETTRFATAIPLLLISTLLCIAQSSSAPVPVTSRFVGT
jgi:hypothetical protein